MRAERTSRRSRKTRCDLITATRALLEEQGLSALTVKTITQRADVGHGTFYHHFTSTEDAVAAGIEDSMREFAEALVRDFSDAPDKSWVFVESTARIFRMLSSHPALVWMLERPHVLATALRDACGPFALRDLQAMALAGEVRAEVIPGSTLYWEWIFIGALVDSEARPAERRIVETSLVQLVLRMLLLPDKKIHALLERLRPEESLDAASGKGAGR